MSRVRDAFKIAGLAVIVCSCGNGLEGVDVAISKSLISSSAPRLVNGGTLVGTVGETMTTYQFPNAGSSPTSCTVVPALASGLSLSPSCDIFGTPDSVQPLQTYTVTGSNAGGSSSARISVLINDAAPSLQNGGSVVGFLNSAITPFSFTNLGGAVTSCQAFPSLPAGVSVSVSSGSCVLSGTPTAVALPVSYTILGSNASGSDSATINFSASSLAPVLSSGLSLVTSIGAAVSSLLFSNSGGGATSCSVSPALPAGLVVSVLSGNCVISGVPSALAALATYTVTATNAAGSDSAPAVLTVNNSAPILATPLNLVTSLLSAITPVSLVNSGGDVSSCAITPSLPPGLSIGVSGNTCEISGIPTLVSALTSYTVTATNALGSDTAQIGIAIGDIAPALGNLGLLSATLLSPISALDFMNSGGIPTSCSASPTLPAGLALSVVGGTCQITGTPTQVLSSLLYTITASNSMGSSSGTVNLAVANIAPLLSNAPNLSIPILGLLSPVTFLNSGGDATSCSVSPALPLGLLVSLTGGTCQLSGLPTVVAGLLSYTVTATNAVGSSDATVSIVTNDVAPSLSAAAPITANFLTLMLPMNLGNSGGAALLCSSSPPLPAGLAVAALLGTCQITGLPLATSATDDYTITATNLVGSSDVVQTITVLP